MEDITQGFGLWCLMADEDTWLGDCWGFINRDRMLFTETDEKQQPTGRTFNLLKVQSWERKK